MSRKKSNRVEKIIPGSLAFRLLQLKGEKTLAVFANEIGCLKASLDINIFGKKGKPPAIPSADFIEKVVKATGVDANWLLTGTGPMLRGEVNEREQEAKQPGGEGEEKVQDVQFYLNLAEEILNSPEYREALISDIQIIHRGMAAEAKIEELKKNGEIRPIPKAQEGAG